MNERSSAELEHEAERVRADMAETAATLREKMSPSQLMDEVAGYFRNGDASTLVQNVKTQVRDNPLALGLIGAGLAWLMAGRGVRAAAQDYYYRRTEDMGRETSDYSGAYGADFDSTYPERSRLSGSEGLTTSSYGSTRTDMSESGHGSGSDESGSESGGLRQGISDTLSAARDRASSAAESIQSAAGSLGDSARDMLRGASDRASGMTHSLRDRTGHLAGQTRRTFLDTLEREPLIIGAIGLAVGAAVGAMLPSTRYEEELVGDQREQLKRKAGEAVRYGIEEAKEVAREVSDAALSAAKEKSEEEGLLPNGGKPMADKLRDVAAAATSAAQEAAERKLSSDESSSSGSSAGSTGSTGSTSSTNSTGSTKSTGSPTSPGSRPF